MDWFTPTEAIQAFKAGSLALMPPQFVILTELQKYAFDELRGFLGKRDKPGIVPIMPEPYISQNDGFVLLLPGDDMHSTTAMATSAKTTPTKNRLGIVRDEKGIKDIIHIQSKQDPLLHKL